MKHSVVAIFNHYLFLSLSLNLLPSFAVEAAATKIQAAFRGHKVRREMKQGDGVTGAEGQQKQDAQQTEREPTKEELEAEFDPNDQGKRRGVV